MLLQSRLGRRRPWGGSIKPLAITAGPWSSIRPCWSASLNRGILAYNNGRNADAIADFSQALRSAPDERSSALINYNLALAYAADGDRGRALASARLALVHGHDDARDLADRLGRGPKGP